MVTWQPRRHPHVTGSKSTSIGPRSTWPAYFGVTALLVIIVVALVGGMIWYNLRKSTELMVAEAERRMVERDAMISDRIRLLYDPLYAIVGFASQVPEIKAPINEYGHVGMPMLLRMLRFYPQIFSLFVGFENGDFFTVAHVAGQSRTRFRSFSERRKTPPSQTRSSHAAATVCGLNAGYFSTTTVLRLESATPHRRPSTRGSVLGMGRRCAATMWS